MAGDHGSGEQVYQDETEAAGHAGQKEKDMETIKVYLDNMFLNIPDTRRQNP